MFQNIEKIGKNAFKDLSKGSVIKIKGVKGKSKTRLINGIKKQTNAAVK